VGDLKSELHGAEMKVLDAKQKYAASKKDYVEHLKADTETENVMKAMRTQVIKKGDGGQTGIDKINKIITALQKWGKVKVDEMDAEMKAKEFESVKAAYTVAIEKAGTGAAEEGEEAMSQGAADW
jgi:hypothetical protein